MLEVSSVLSVACAMLFGIELPEIYIGLDSLNDQTVRPISDGMS
jgi:hypothetical protein